MSFLNNDPVKLLLAIIVLYISSLVSVSTLPLLVISFDGFRYDYLDMYPTPNFKRVADTGVRAKWMTSVFVTKTYPNHFSIITGLYEETHGIVGNNMFDPVLNETFEFDNHDPRWWYNGVSVPIWVANQQASANRHSGSVMWVSTNVPYFGQSIKHLLNYNTNVSFEDRLDLALKWITTDKDPANLVLLYIEQPDETGHKFGPKCKQMEDTVVKVDNLVGYLLDQLKVKKLLDKINFILLSDHGMAEVPQGNVIYMDKIIQNSSSYRHFGHSPVWNVLPEPGEMEKVRSALRAGTLLYHYTFYEKESIPVEYHYKNHRRVMPFIVVADEGWDFAFTNDTWNTSSNHSGGDHGYNNSLMSMRPIFLAHGPAFKKNFTAEPFMNVDVYPLMCTLLGLTAPTNINGSLDRIKHVLADNYWYSNISSISGTGVIVGVTILCLCLAGFLSSVVIKAACNRGPPTVSFVPLKQHLIYRDDPSVGEEQSKLLQAIDATD